MWDIAYLLITILFFATMLWYVQGCDRLGRTSVTREHDDDQPAGGWRTRGN